MSGLLLGIDVGTYSSKGVLVAADGTLLKTVVVEHEMSVPHPGWAEQDADAVWWGDVVRICRELLNGDPHRGADVSAVALSAIGACMLPLDSNDRPLRPGILYGVDTRAHRQMDALNQRWGEQAIYDFSGMALTSQAVGPKILWMRENEPDLWRRVAHVTTASSYLILRLTGEHVIDRHTASDYAPLPPGCERPGKSRLTRAAKPSTTRCTPITVCSTSARATSRIALGDRIGPLRAGNRSRALSRAPFNYGQSLSATLGARCPCCIPVGLHRAHLALSHRHRKGKALTCIGLG